MQRRNFLARTTLAASGLLFSGATSRAETGHAAGTTEDAPFLLSLKADAIGIGGSLDDLLRLAVDHGYTALSVPPHLVAELSDGERKDFVGRAADAGIGWGSSGLPVEFRQSEERFRNDLTELRQHADNLAALGISRIATWIMPCNDELAYRGNFARHAERLGAVAEVLKGSGDFTLGLEYVGTQTLRFSKRYTFIHSGKQLRELVTAIGTGNVGVILDSFHWYTADESVEDLAIWSADEIVAVDLNDATSGLSRGAQIDGMRELPGATGKIDIAAFLNAVAATGFNGPVRSEPFNATLNAMRAELAAAASIDAIRGVLGTAGE